MTGDWTDLAFKAYLIVGGFHYTFDSFVKIYYYGAGIIYEGCKFSYFLHHVSTLFVFKCLWMLDYYPWFISFPLSWHCVMVAYPRFHYNNHIYGVGIFFFVLLPLLVKPFSENKVHRSIILKFPILLVPIILMAMDECAEQWDIDDMKRRWDASWQMTAN